MDSTDRSAAANDGILMKAGSWLRGAATSSLILWGYLFLITLAELIISIPPDVIASAQDSRFLGGIARILTSIGPAQAGLVMHMAILIALIINTVIGFDDTTRKLARALTLAPLIRILSVGMPLRLVPQVAWYPLVSIPLLIATWIIIRQTGVSRRSLGLQRGNVWIQLMLVGGGFGLGALEYVILRPDSILPSLTLQTLVIPALSLLIFTGFSEELIFRGLLQALAIPVLGSWALTYVALVFGVLHIGYLSVWDVVFVFVVGFLFAYLAQWGGSILGLTFAHGLTNTTLFLILPYLNDHPEHPAARIMPWIITIGSALSLVGIALLWQQTHPEVRPALPMPQARAAAARAAQWGSQGARMFPRVMQFRTALAFMVGTFFGLAISGLIFDLRNRPPSVVVAPETPERGTPIAAGVGASTPTIEVTQVAGVVPTATPSEPDGVATTTTAPNPTRPAATTGAATATPTPNPAVVITDLPWPAFLPDGLTLAVADSWPFQMIGPDQVGQPFLVFRDEERWLVLRRQPASTQVIPASASTQRLKVGEAPATLLSYADQGLTLTWEQAGTPLQISAVGLTVDDVVRVGARVEPQTPAELQARLAEAATLAGIEVTALWPSSLPDGFAIVPAEISMEFSDPSDDASLAGYTVSFARGEARFQIGGGTLAPPQVTGTTERINGGNRSATLTTGQNRFLLTIEGTPDQLAVPAGAVPGLPLVQAGRVFVLADNLDRAAFDQFVADLLPVRPLEFVGRVSGQNIREMFYLWPDPLPDGYTFDDTSVRTSWQDYVLQGGRPYYELSAIATDGAVVTVQGGGDAFLVPEGEDVEQVTARVHGQGATAVQTAEGVVVFWTEQGTFFTVTASAMDLDETIAFADSLKSILPSTFDERIQ